MANIVSVDEFITDDWYPGFKPEYKQPGSVIEQLNTFSKEDERRFWFMDFHWPRGLTPMGLLWVEDGYAWGSQLAAHCLPLPPGKGIVQRIAGTHIYASEVPVTSEWEMGERGKRIAQNLPVFLANFDDIWKTRVAELESGLEYFENYVVAGKSLRDLGAFLREARTFQKRAWEIHFEVMYPLLANYLGFYGACTEFGIDPGQISKFLQGYDTKILETDRELWKLTALARKPEIAQIFAATEAGQLHAALSGAGGAAGDWLRSFQAFLKVYGSRTEGISDIALAPWVEDPTSPLGTIKTFLQKPTDHDFKTAHEHSIAEREASVDAARSKLSKSEREAFDAGLDSCRKANFAWWNEEHNYYIDLRASIPMRRASLAIGEALSCERRDDTLFLFWPEIVSVADGEKNILRLPQYRQRPARLLRPLECAAAHDAEAARHDPRCRDGSDPHRDFRHASPLLRCDEGAGDERYDPDGRCSVGGRRKRNRARPAQRGRATSHRAGRDPRVRSDLPKLDARFR